MKLDHKHTYILYSAPSACSRRYAYQQELLRTTNLIISQKPRICGCILYFDLGAKIGRQCAGKYVLRNGANTLHILLM
jgi:hypothetical protein